MQPHYPVGIQNFESLRSDGFLYIDKTALIYQLVNTGRYYLLTRPQLFGKSLMLSTLHAYFQGKKELFEGLAIEKLEKDWVTHPVLHLDLEETQINNVDDLVTILNYKLVNWENLYGSDPAESTLPSRFAGVIERAYIKTGQRVVVLVDGYDLPLLQSFHVQALHKKLTNMLQAFYGVLKSMDRVIRFAMLTGVNKFGRSGWDDFEDISISKTFANLCGISEREIHDYLEEGVHAFASANKLSYEEAWAKLKKYHGGYHFSTDTESIYNPFSLLIALEDRRIENYWFRTKNPSYLLNLLRNSNMAREFETPISGDALNIFDDRKPLSIMYQSGYMTIQDYDEEHGTYKLKFPNLEVEEGFFTYMLRNYNRINPFGMGRRVPRNV